MELLSEHLYTPQRLGAYRARRCLELEIPNAAQAHLTKTSAEQSMGRWAQARRRGGGNQPLSAGALVTDATITDSNQVTFSFDGPVTAADFGAADFVISGAPSDNVAQHGPTGLDVETTVPPADGDPWSLSTTASGVASPQSGTVHV
jgi:hypothetical protein